MATVLVVVTLMLLVSLLLMSLWSADVMLFSKMNYVRRQRANIESLFVLYSHDPEIVGRDTARTVTLFDTVPGSTMSVNRKLWGLYEIVSVASECGKVRQSRLMGTGEPYKERCSFWYRDDRSSLTLTGNSNIRGRMLLPQNGLVYGQMQSVFFSGERVAAEAIGQSGREMPGVSADVEKHIKELQDMSDDVYETVGVDSLNVGFTNGTHVFCPDGGTIANCSLSGNIIAVGDSIYVDRSASLHDILIVGNSVSVGDGFCGSLQVFARDTVLVGSDVLLEYPSGVYSRCYAGIGERTQVNGYVIVDYTDDVDLKRPNGRMARSSVVRGLLWNSGIMQLQGIVTGTAFLNKGVYYAPHGYYQNMLYDATILENADVAYPLWMDGGRQRKVVKWVN